MERNERKAGESYLVLRTFKIGRGFQWKEQRGNHRSVAPGPDNSLRLTRLPAGRWPSGITQMFAALLNVSYESFE